MANNRINYSIGFDVDQSGLNKAKAALQELKNLTASDLAKINFSGLDEAQKDLTKIRNSIVELEGALKKSFNQDLGTLNLTKFNQQLKNLDLDRIYKDFSRAGEAGRAAFRGIATDVLTTNMKLKQSHKVLDDIANTMKNTAKWGLASSVMNSFTNSVQQAYGYVKHLDSSLNDIRIVTGYSADEMDRFAEKANKAAKNLAASTTDYTEAALIYYQQGLSGDEVEKRAETTLKAANVTGQDAAAVSEQLTAVWNGYKVSAQETEMYVDKLAAVAASTAADLEELSTGMSKVASAAEASGVDMDQLGATLSTVISVTRQAPESVGTAFKTIYARLGDLAVDGEDEFGTKLGEVSSKLKTMGIDILDSQGQMRDMGVVVEEVAAKWDTWTDAQQQAAAVAMAGKRQYNNLIALFENWDMYESSLQVSQNSLGTLSQQQEIYLDSAEAKLQQLKTAQEGLYDSLLDADTIKEVASLLTGLVSGLEKFVDGIGGGSTVLIGLGAIATKVFSKQIGKGIFTTIQNFKTMKLNMEQAAAAPETINLMIEKLGNGVDHTTKSVLELNKELSKVAGTLSEEEYNEVNKLVQGYSEAATAVEKYNDQKEKTSSNLARLSGGVVGEDELDDVEKKGNQNFLSEDNKNDIKKAESYQKIAAALKEVENEQKKTISLANNYKEALDAQAQINLEKPSEEAYKSALKLNRLQEKLIDNAIELSNSTKLDSSPIQEEIQKILREYSQLEDKAGAEADELMVKLANASERAAQEIQVDVQETKKGIEQAANGASEKAQQEAKEAALKIQAEMQKLQSAGKVQSFVNLAEGAEMAIFGIMAVSNAFKVLQDDSLSTKEKLGQVFMAFLTAIPMLYSGVTTAGTALISLAASTSAANAASLTAVTGVGKLTKAVKILFDVIGNHPIALAITGIVAAVGIAIAVVKNWKTEEEKAAETTAKNLESANKALQETQQRVADITTSLEGWKDASSALEDLTVGTAEWNQKLIEANNHILDLLQKYPELAEMGAISTDENGVMSISSEGLDYIAEQQNNELKTAQRNQIVASKDNLEAQNNLLKTGQSDDFEGASTAEKSNIEAAINKYLEDGYLGATEEELKNQGFYDDQIATIQKWQKEIQTATQQIATNDAAMEAYNTTLANLDLQDDARFKNLDSKDQGLVSKAYQKEYNETYDKKKADVDTWSEADVKDAYKNLTGATNTRENDDGVTEYKIGDEWYQMEDAAARQAIAADQTSAELEDFTSGLRTAGEGLLWFRDKLLEDNNEAIGARDAMTEDQADVIAQMEKGDSTTDLSALSDEDLSNMRMGVAGKNKENDYTFTTAQAENAGFEVSEEGIQDFKNHIYDLIVAEQEARAEAKQQEEENAVNAINKGWSDLGLTSEEAQAAFDDLDWTEYDRRQKDGDESLPSKSDIVQNMNTDDIDQIKLSRGNAKEIEKWNAERERSEDELIQNSEIEQRGQTVEEIEEQAEAYQAAAESSDKIADSLKNNDKVAKEVASRQKKYNEAMDRGVQLQEDFGEILDDNNKIHEDWTKATKEFNGVLGDTFNLAEGTDLGEDFLGDPENWDLYKKYLEGDIDAFNELSNRVIQASEDFKGLGENMQTEVATGLDMIDTQLAENNFEIGATFDDLGISNEVQNWLNQGVDPLVVEGILDKKGLDVQFEWVEFPENTFATRENGVAMIPVPDEDGFHMEEAPYDINVQKANDAGGFYKVVGGNSSYSGAPGAGSNSRPKSSGGGGGGGGGGKAKKSYKSSTKARDPFRKVNNRISKLGHQMDKLADAQDKLMGPRLTKNLNAQLDILKKQKQAAKDKLDIALNEARLLRETRLKNERKGYYNDLGDFGINFNSKTGEMTNFDAKMKYWDDEVRRLNNKWNDLTAKQQEGKKGEALEKEIEKAEANRDKLKELGEQYDEYIYETIPELRTQIQEYAYQEIELKLKLLKVDAELQLDITDALNNLADFRKELIDLMDYASLGVDDELSARVAKNVKTALANETLLFGYSRDEAGNIITDENGNVIKTKNYLTDDESIITEETENINTLKAELEKYYQDPNNYNGEYSALGEDGKWYFDEKTFRDELEASRDNLAEAYQDILDKQKEVREAYLDTIDAYAESYASQVEILEQHERQLEHNLELAKLVNGEERYSDYQATLNDAVNKAGAIMNIRRAEMEKYKAKMESAKENSEEREKWKQLYLESIEAYNEANIDHVNKMKEAYENTVLAHADAIFGTDRELENQDKLWEIETAKNEEYLDNIDKAYEIQKLNRKLQKDMEKGSLATQQKLKKFRDEELKKLKEKDKLTQYDVDRANQLYEIELKKLALQESQMNKSKMRLRRDSSGNYSYQFVADEESAENARQELEDAQYSLRQLDEEETKRLSEKQKQLLRDFKEYYTQYHSLTRTEQQEQAVTYNKVYAYYMDELQKTGLKAQEVLNNFNDSSFDLSQTLFKQDESLFSGLTDAQKAALADSSKNFADLAADTQKAFQNSLLPSWTSTVDAMIAKFGGDGWDSFKTSVETNTQRIAEAMTALYNGIEANKTQSDTIAATTNEFLADELEARQGITTEIETQLGVLEKMNDQLAIQADLYGEIADAAEEAIEAANELLADNSLADGDGVSGTRGGDGTDGSTSATLPDDDNTVTQGNKKLNAGDKIKVESATFYDKPEKGRKEIDSEYGANSYLYITKHPKKGVYKKVNGVTYVHIGTQDTYSQATSVGWIKKKNIKGYDTGGYTGGGWSDEYKKQGKLAFLHEKELVLNAHDTDNMFKMLNIIRQLQTGKIGSNEQPLQEIQNDFMKYNDLTYEQLNLIIQLLQDKMDIQQSLTLEDVTSIIDSISNTNKRYIDNTALEQYTASIQSMLEQYKTLHLSRIVNGSNNTDVILDKMNTILDMQNKELLDQAGQSTSVVINAEFPEARSAEQILQAFDNLEMITSQRLGYEKSRKYK